MTESNERRELEIGGNHLKRCRWYALGGFEIAITETTIRGHFVDVRTRIDTPPPETVESQQHTI